MKVSEFSSFLAGLDQDLEIKIRIDRLGRSCVYVDIILDDYELDSTYDERGNLECYCISTPTLDI